MHIDDMIHVLTAYKNGKTIQFKNEFTNGRWMNVATPAFWDFTSQEYRVKPEPREFWINEYPTGPSGAHFLTREEAAGYAACNCIGCIRVREVLE